MHHLSQDANDKGPASAPLAKQIFICRKRKTWVKEYKKGKEKKKPNDTANSIANRITTKTYEPTKKGRGKTKLGKRRMEYARGPR